LLQKSGIKSDVRSLDITVTRLLMKLFRISNKRVINECCSYFNSQAITQWNTACTVWAFCMYIQRYNSWDCRLYCDHDLVTAP